MQNLKSILVGLLLVSTPALAFSPAPLKVPDLADQAHFFSNSIRTDIPAGEGKFLLNFFYDVEKAIEAYEKQNGPMSEDYKRTIREKWADLPGCSAYFVENKDHRVLVGSARHCVNFDAKAECAKHFRMKAYATGDIGTCESVLIEDEDADYVIFEAKFEGHPDEYNLVEQLTPAMIFPKGDEEVEAYGFPADDERNSLPTKSFSCHLFNAYADPEYKNFYANFLDEESKKASTDTSGAYDEKFQEGALKIYKNETMLRHNCSIYGGNSGGPMILKGTHYLIGMPESYNPTHQVFPPDKYGILGTPLHVHTKYSGDFEKYGIPFEMLNQPPANVSEI